MSVLESTALDMSVILLKAYELGDTINSSAEVADYLYWKNKLAQDGEAQALIRRFSRSKDKFEECQRFGHFHPDYHAAMREAETAKAELECSPVIANFKQAEEQLDRLLHSLSETIAFSVSDTIKVPGNESADAGSGCSSCGSGGSCGGKCG